MSMTDTKQDGRVVAIAGPVIDVEFPRGSLPELNSAIQFEITHEGTTTVVLAEVAQQLGNSRVRAANPTGLKLLRGMLLLLYYQEHHVSLVLR